MYSLESFVLSGPISVLLSLSLIAGVSFVGSNIVRLSGFSANNIDWLKYQNPIIGISFISAALYPLALYSLLNNMILKSIAVAIASVGFIHGIGLLKSLRARIQLLKEKADFNFDKKLLFIISCLIFGYFLFSIGPTTNADSIDYHIGIAISIINNSGITITPEWFHSRLAGSGEVLNALGLIIGAEQFGPLMQFFSLISITSIIYFIKDNASEEDKNWKLTLVLALLCTPVFVFLSGSAKPQLLPLAMTSLAMALLITPYSNTFKAKDRFLNFGLISLLVMSSVQLKFLYLLGGGVIGLTAYCIMIKDGYLFKATMIGSFFFVLVMMPSMVWKIIYYDSSIFGSLVAAFPGELPGYSNFEDMHRSYSDGPFPFPLFLILPASVGKITMIIGLSLFVCIFLKFPKTVDLKIVYSLSFFVLVFMAIFGPDTTRHFLEPFVWILIGLSIQGKQNITVRAITRINILLIIQSAGVIMMLTFGIISTLPGIFSNQLRHDLLTKNANGYDLMVWANSTLLPDAVMLVPNRSMSFSNNKLMSLDWMEYTDLNGTDPLIYLDQIKKGGATHIMILEDDYTQSETFKVFEGCIGNDVIGPRENYLATRNPFNRTKNKNAWILNYNSASLPGCYVAKFEN